ncbi:response regulator transcription factor [soil metagenome]
MTEASAARILVVEDDAEMGRLVVRGLGSEGYEPTLVTDGVAALIEATNAGFAVAILDVMLPGMSGLELCRRLRAAHPSLPIILLTARDAVDDRVKGLDAGADDYLTKPFAFSELAARLRAMLRRENNVVKPTLQIGEVVLDRHDHTVRAGGVAVPVSPKEFAVLRMLAEHRDETVTRHDLLLEVWGSVDHTDANVVDQYVSYLRRKFDPDLSGLVITTVRGVGFALTVES